MASIRPYKNPSGEVVWRVQFRVDGKAKQETFLNEDGAREFGSLVDRVGGEAARKVLDSRRGNQSVTPTLREWIARYLDEQSGLLTGIEPGTRAGYRRAADASFLPMLGDIPVDVISKSDVGRWINWQEKQPSPRGGTIAPKTIQNYHAILSAALGAARDEGLREDNPAYKSRITKGRSREGVFLTSQEFATILFFIPEFWRSLVLFLAGTGCRWGEATAVTEGDQNFDATPVTVRIDKAWKKGEHGIPVLKQPKSRRSKRTISYDDLLTSVMRDRRTGDSEQLLFPNRYGNRVAHGRFRNSVWLPALRKAQDPERCAEHGLTPIKKQPTIHDLRHTHASWLIASGMPLPYVQARLGHESINTTVGVYGHLVPDVHQQLASAVGGSLTAAQGILELETVDEMPEIEAD